MRSVLAVGMFALFSLFACETSTTTGGNIRPEESTSRDESSASCEDVNISKIYSAYDSNPILGADLYEDETLCISGWVSDIRESDISDGGQLIIRSAPVAGKSAEANFDESERGDLRQLNRDDLIKIRCRGGGFEKDVTSDLYITQSTYWMDRCKILAQ